MENKIKKYSEWKELNEGFQNPKANTEAAVTSRLVRDIDIAKKEETIYTVKEFISKLNDWEDSWVNVVNPGEGEAGKEIVKKLMYDIIESDDRTAIDNTIKILEEWGDVRNFTQDTILTFIYRLLGAIVSGDIKLSDIAVELHSTDVTDYGKNRSHLTIDNIDKLIEMRIVNAYIVSDDGMFEGENLYLLVINDEHRTSFDI